MPRAMRLSELCRSHLNIGCLSQRANHQGLETARTRPLPSHRGRASQRPGGIGGVARKCEGGRCRVRRAAFRGIADSQVLQHGLTGLLSFGEHLKG